MPETLQLIIQPDVQAIFDHFSSLIGVRIAFFSPDGETLRVGVQRSLCPFCDLISDSLGLRHKCLAQDEVKRLAAQKTGRMIRYHCHAGLLEAIKPVTIDGVFVGYIMIGQMRTREKIQVAIDKKWRKKIGNGRLELAFNRMHQFSSTEYRHVLGLLDALVEHIISRSLIRPRISSTIEAAVEYLRSNPRRNVSLGEVARSVHRSPSTLSRLFRVKLGKSFKQVHTQMRLDQAEKLLNKGGTTVKAVSLHLGFDDPLYFSRLFRKHKGVPPSDLLRDKPIRE